MIFDSGWVEVMPQTIPAPFSYTDADELGPPRVDILNEEIGVEMMSLENRDVDTLVVSLSKAQREVFSTSLLDTALELVDDLTEALETFGVENDDEGELRDRRSGLLRRYRRAQDAARPPRPKT